MELTEGKHNFGGGGGSVPTLGCFLFSEGAEPSLPAVSCSVTVRTQAPSPLTVLQ